MCMLVVEDRPAEAVQIFDGLASSVDKDIFHAESSRMPGALAKMRAELMGVLRGKSPRLHERMVQDAFHLHVVDAMIMGWTFDMFSQKLEKEPLLALWQGLLASQDPRRMLLEFAANLLIDGQPLFTGTELSEAMGVILKLPERLQTAAEVARIMKLEPEPEEAEEPKEPVEPVEPMQPEKNSEPAAQAAPPVPVPARGAKVRRLATNCMPMPRTRGPWKALAVVIFPLVWALGPKPHVSPKPKPKLRMPQIRIPRLNMPRLPMLSPKKARPQCHQNVPLPVTKHD